MRSRIAIAALVTVMVVCVGQSALAQDEWKFGIGTGISSFSLDGDIGFPLDIGGAVIFDVDLDNGDTQDLIESGFGLGGYASKGKWTILFNGGTSTLEDNDGPLDAEWDRTNISASVGYNFAKTGNNSWGALLGFQRIDHDWDFDTATDSASIDDDWTDAVIGITHRLPFTNEWVWSNLASAGFGGSEGSFTLASTITWRPLVHWSFSFGVKQYSVEFGDKDDIGDSDFYYYDIDEPAVVLGFMYNW